MNVVEALANTSVGKLKYDKNWIEEGRTKEILDYVSQFSTNISINRSHTLSPRALSQAINPEIEDIVKSIDKEGDSPTKLNSEKSREKPKSSDTCFYALQTESEVRILEYEEERLKYLEVTFRSKKDEFESFSNNLEQQTDQQYFLLKRNNELNEKRKAADLQKIEEAILAEAKQKESLKKEQYQSQAKKLSAIVQEAELKLQKAEEESRKKQQEQLEFSQHLNNCKAEIESVATKAKQRLEAFEYSSYLKTSVAERLNQLSDFQTNIKTIENILGTQLLTLEDISNAYAVVKKVYEFSQDLTNDLELAKVAALQDHERKLLVLKENVATKEIHKISISASEPGPGAQRSSSEQKPDGTKDSSKKKASAEAKAVLSAFIAPDVVEEHHRIKENLKSVKNGIQPFVEDPNNKKYRFELQKSINVPINAISSISGSHVRDKINKLLSILKSSNFNNSTIYNFCADLVAKKLVEQGDKQISAQYSTAFPIALVVVGIWQKKPDIGLLILGHFYENCPYLVPYHPPPQEGQTDKDYYKSLGYYFDKEGNMEAKYKFLSRMSGFMRLYAAILVSPVMPSAGKQPHPHGIANGWQWLSRTLNMAPRPDITATLLYDFLDVAGNMLNRTYGKQFKKLLHIICKDFFQKVKQVTPSGSGGPVERLETFLQQAVKRGYIPPPEGILDASFWSR